MFIHISGGSWGKQGVRAFSGKASFDGILGPRILSWMHLGVVVICNDDRDAGAWRA
jgi:hypothetical protein